MCAVLSAVDGVNELKRQLVAAQQEAASAKARLAAGGATASKQSDDTGDVFDLGELRAENEVTLGFLIAL
eukprot:COSAG05_NODE_801_length_7224_cov_4.552000_15_plen_70_part_00